MVTLVSSHANRGNVAIIAWNTLEANAVWDVTGTEYAEGTINLTNSGRSLLSIYFRDYATKNGELKEIAEVEITDANIDDRQLKIAGVEFENEFDKEPRKDKAEKSYKVEEVKLDEDDEEYIETYVRIFVPEEVCEDLDELDGKVVTIILGKDNVAVAILVEEDVAEKDFLTAYDVVKGKITVAGTKYSLADKYEVVLNGVKHVAAGNAAKVGYANLNEALVAIDADMDLEEIEKKIQAEIKLNDDGEVKFIELTASAYIPNVSDEVLVKKVKETKSKYTITTTKGKITWDIEEENDEEIEFPKVYVDGARADIRDIVPGMVLSVFGMDLNDGMELLDDDFKDYKIYATTTGVVEGKADRIKKANLAITMDGTVYAASNADVKMSTEELDKYDTNTAVKNGLEAVVDNDTVTLYLNMFGEYAFITLDEVASNWTFGVVTYVDDSFVRSGDEKEFQEVTIRLLLADGSKPYYTIKLDTSDEDILEDLDVDNLTELTDTLDKGMFVAVNASADKVITIEDGSEIVIIKNDATLIDIADNAGDLDDYIVKPVGRETTDKDDEEFGEYEYTSNTTIFNTQLKEIVSKWNAILDKNNSKAFADANTIAIFEDDEDNEALYIVVALGEAAYGNEDAVYAIVEESENVGDKTYVKFVDEDEMEAKDINLLDEGWLVAYKTASSKVSDVQKLIDVKNIAKATDIKKVYDYLFDDIKVACPNDAQDTLTTCTECTLVKAYEPAENAEHGTLVCGAATGTAVANHVAGCSNASTAVDTTPCTGTYACPNDSQDTLTTCTECTLVKAYKPAVKAVHGKVKENIFFALTTATAPEGTKFVNNIDENTKMEAIVLDEIDVKASGKLTLKYVKTGDDDEEAIDSVKLDKDIVKVYDLRNNSVEEISVNTLVEEVNTDGEEVYVIAAVNGDYDKDGANVVFIVK